MLSSRVLRIAAIALAVLAPARAEEADDRSIDALATRETLVVAGRTAFVMEPPEATRDTGPRPWVGYAATLGNGLPGNAEKWMFDRFHAAGIAIAGIDVGESYGSPDGRAHYQTLYDHLTRQRGYAARPVLLARSRGGLMLYNWAVEHPAAVGGIAGIYPVCNIASYPGVARAAGAYKMSAAELTRRLPEHNPIERLEPLAKAKVPIYHIHGDRDGTVPLDANSALLGKRYAAYGGPVEIEVIPGQGHNMWRGWFESQPLTDFILARALDQPR